MAAAEPMTNDQGKERRRGADAMLRHKILIVSSEASMRRALKRLMTATGAVTEFVNDLSKLPEEPPSLIAVDLRGPSGPKMKDLEHVFPEVRVIAIVGAQDFGQMVEAVRSPRCGSVITYDEKFEPEDFIVTVTKLLHGQVFGLQKYFPWGVTLYNMEIASYEEKVKAIDVLNAYAELAGARGPVRDRMALVAEELMINAMYHAPTDDDGKPLYQHLPRKEMSGKKFERPVKVACASNGQLFAVAVRDAFGSLDKDTVVKFLSKGTQKSLTPEQKESGAGLGLVTALKNANKLVFNLAPGSGTEVIALFDLDLLAKGRPGVRAVHIFTERRKVAAPAPEVTSLRPSAAPLIAGALAIVLIIFGVVGVVRKLQEPPPAEVKAELTVRDGESRAVPLRLGSEDVKLKVERKGSNLVITSEK
jgi:Histidine kinase-like ATPase domain